jgi:hypothetical protein
MSLLEGNPFVNASDVYTEEGRKPFSSEHEKCIENMFCKGQVWQAEHELGFIGWVVCGERPLARVSIFENTLGYGYGGVIFQNYELAIQVCVRTHEYRKRVGHQSIELRVFSVVLAMIQDAAGR